MVSQKKESSSLSLRIFMNDIKICIREINRSEPVGVICHCCLKDPLPFYGMGELILKIDRLCDDMGFPEASPERRTLHSRMKEKEELHFYHDFKEFGVMKGEIFAIFITLRYRQNVSWQGSVHFSGDATVYQFRSVLELMGFMMEKFEELGGQGGEYARETVES